jgi:hypothetical protein
MVELTALSKVVEKQIKEKKDAGETIDPGNYEYDFCLHVEGRLSRGDDTKVTPNFYMDKHLKALLLRYAAAMPKKEGQEWLKNLLDINGALGAVVKLGPDVVTKSVDQSLTALWENSEKEAKATFQATQPKTDRAGNTIAVADITRLPKEAKTVISAKKKPK